MKPIPIGGLPRQKKSQDAQANDGNSTETGYELMLTDEAMQEWRDAEARELAQNKARLAGTGMVGTLLDIKV
ncbi:MAG TPA: hypothetical protein VGE69_03725 [Pseudomonadales bacterium]